MVVICALFHNIAWHPTVSAVIRIGAGIAVPAALIRFSNQPDAEALRSRNQTTPVPSGRAPLPFIRRSPNIPAASPSTRSAMPIRPDGA